MEEGVVGVGNNHTLDTPYQLLSTLRTSLIVDARYSTVVIAAGDNNTLGKAWSPSEEVIPLDKNVVMLLLLLIIPCASVHAAARFTLCVSHRVQVYKAEVWDEAEEVEDPYPCGEGIEELSGEEVEDPYLCGEALDCEYGEAEEGEEAAEEYGEKTEEGDINNLVGDLEGEFITAVPD